MDEQLERDHEDGDPKDVAPKERAHDTTARSLATAEHALEPVFVVVETDQHEQHYDEQLATLLADGERRQREHRRLPFPRTHRISDEALRRDYVRAHVRPSQDAVWHFRAWLPRTARAVRSATAAIRTPGDPATTLTTLRLDGPKTSIDVLTLRLHERANLAEWLDEWLAQLGMTAASSRPRHTVNGIMGDVLATRRDQSDETVLRYTTVQQGTRVFVIVLRTPLLHYPMIARDFVLFATTFAPTELEGTKPGTVSSTEHSSTGHSSSGQQQQAIDE